MANGTSRGKTENKGKAKPKASGKAKAKKTGRIRIGSADFTMLVLTCALVIFGVIMVFSASYYWSIDKMGNPYSFLIRDIIWAVTGFAMMVGTMVIDYHKYKKIAPWLIGIGLLLLVAVLFIGDNINGATRWISIGPITIMPGEIIKICVIIFTAWWLDKEVNIVNNPIKGIIPMLALAGICGLLIMQQPNMSTAITVVLIIVAMMFVAGLKLPYLIVLAGGGFAGGLFMIISGGGYRLKRLMSFMDPFADPLGDGYQVTQGLLALGSGGLFGQGLGHSVQKNLYLPEPQNDFILAIIGEELGYLAILTLMLVYIFLIWRGIKIVLNAPDRFGMLLGSGVIMMIGIQLMMNVAVVTSSMPPTGVTLPFISYGGNALWLFMLSMGILLNISRQSAPKAKKAKDPSKAFRPRSVTRRGTYKDGTNKIGIR
jgi:cell division protein FtsW